MKHWRAAAPLLALLWLLIARIPAASADSSYVVQPGDTLYRIAVRFGMTTQQLALANNIANPDYIFYGQTLIIPDGSEPTPTDESTAADTGSSQNNTYVVQAGDNLYRIALRYGLTYQQLAQANGIVNPGFVYAGQVLVIPDGSGTFEPPAPQPVILPSGIAADERWIDVNLSTQSLTAYEGSTPVFNSLVSSGTWAHPTVTGEFRVWLRYQSQTMNGYRLGYDYYLPDVPYVMYFYRDYALHGTYWHNNFGTPMSHGCVNLPTTAAQWIYNWSDYGTLVRVHY